VADRGLLEGVPINFASESLMALFAAAWRHYWTKAEKNPWTAGRYSITTSGCDGRADRFKNWFHKVGGNWPVTNDCFSGDWPTFKRALASVWRRTELQMKSQISTKRVRCRSDSRCDLTHPDQQYRLLSHAIHSPFNQYVMDLREQLALDSYIILYQSNAEQKEWDRTKWVKRCRESHLSFCDLSTFYLEFRTQLGNWRLPILQVYYSVSFRKAQGPGTHFSSVANSCKPSATSHWQLIDSSKGVCRTRAPWLQAATPS
jgi:hypothetical protein